MSLFFLPHSLPRLHPRGVLGFGVWVWGNVSMYVCTRKERNRGKSEVVDSKSSGIEQATGRRTHEHTHAKSKKLAQENFSHVHVYIRCQPRYKYIDQPVGFGLVDEKGKASKGLFLAAL